MIETNEAHMKRIITIVLMILIYVLFLTFFTIITINFIIPTINIPLADIAMFLLFDLSILVFVITIVFLCKPYMKEKKSNKANLITFISTACCFVGTNILIVLHVIMLVLGAVVGGFWGNKNTIELGFNSDDLVSGEIYIGDIINETNIEIEFTGKVNLDNIEYLKFERAQVKSLIINGDVIEFVDNLKINVTEYIGICDYELKIVLGVKCCEVDGYRGFNLSNPYNEKVSTKLSPNLMININDKLSSRQLFICDVGTPYQYRYEKTLMRARWMLFIEYVITTPIFIYFGTIITINSIKQLKRKKKV